MKLSHIFILPVVLSQNLYSNEVRVNVISFKNVRVKNLVQRSTTKSCDTAGKSTENDDAELDVVSIFHLYGRPELEIFKLSCLRSFIDI